MKKLTILIFMFLICVTTCAHAAVPHLISYQGRLTDATGNPLTGSQNITFRIYDAEAAGNLLWQETQNGIVVDKGLFSVFLGSATALNIAFDKQYYLEIKVGEEVMSPRQRITSAGYAIRAEKAEQYDGVGKIGTKQVDEAGLSDGMQPYYDNASGNVKYKIPTVPSFGAWSNTSTYLADGTIYKAPTDGFIVCAFQGSNGPLIWIVYTDEKTTPTTDVLRQGSGSGQYTTGFVCPIKKNHYWYISRSGVSNQVHVVRWLPLGN